MTSPSLLRRGAGAQDPAPAFYSASGHTLPRGLLALFIHLGRELGGETAQDCAYRLERLALRHAQQHARRGCHEAGKDTQGRGNV
jgi:hypothetical protein